MKVKRVLFVSFSALLFILMLAVLELNKNTILGFILTAVVTAGFYAVHRLIVKKKNKWYLKCAAWLGWIALFVGVVLLTWPPVQAVPAVNVKDPETTDIVTVSQGDLQGVYNEDKSVEVYAGIPYAKPPVGELRWKEPQDPKPWDGVLKADHFAPMSMQPQKLPIVNSLTQIIGYHDYEISLDDNYTEPVSEDSLYLNIWKPAGSAKKLPVLVYVHGGSLQTGQPWYADYSGEGLAKEGVIVVEMGYRLGVFGYFADEELAEESPNGTTGNYGMLDQIKALEWVRDNIKSLRRRSRQRHPRGRIGGRGERERTVHLTACEGAVPPRDLRELHRRLRQAAPLLPHDGRGFESRRRNQGEVRLFFR